MKTIIGTAVAFLTATSITFAGDGPTYHICAGIYAHKDNNGMWLLWDKDDKWTASGSRTVASFLQQYCHDKPHAEIHTKRRKMQKMHKW